MPARDDTAVARAILAAALMLALTILGVTWALAVDGPGLLGLTAVVDLIVVFTAYSGMAPSTRRAPDNPSPGAQL